jgi:hypothetical protein
MTAVRCPLCKLQSPENTRQCDCGYEFAGAYGTAAQAGIARTATTDPTAAIYLRSIDQSVRTIKFIVVAWAILTVIGFVVLFFAGVVIGAKG